MSGAPGPILAGLPARPPSELTIKIHHPNGDTQSFISRGMPRGPNGEPSAPTVMSFRTQRTGAPLTHTQPSSIVTAAPKSPEGDLRRHAENTMTVRGSQMGSQRGSARSARGDGS